MFQKFIDWIKGLFGPKAIPKPAPKEPVVIPVKPAPTPEPKAGGVVSSLDKALAYTFVNEGGFSNHQSDRGGATSGYGITIGELARWRKHPVSVSDVKNMTAQEAKDIYEAWYWKPLGCDKLINQGVATCMFDIGVVRGIGVPPKYAQQICNKFGAGLALDGHIGPKTIAAINAIEPKLYIAEFSAKAKAGFLGIVASNPSQVVFIKGWLNRAKRLLTLA